MSEAQGDHRPGCNADPAKKTPPVSKIFENADGPEKAASACIMSAD
jgi:hypothetical protein